MVARASLRLCAALIAQVAFGAAHCSDALPSCKALPGIVKLAQPDYPPDVETRGLPNPVTVLVEFTLHRDGSVSDPSVIESDAGTYATQFAARALQAIRETRFKPAAIDCRGRMRVVFKIVSKQKGSD